MSGWISEVNSGKKNLQKTGMNSKRNSFKILREIFFSIYVEILFKIFDEISLGIFKAIPGKKMNMF